MANEMLTGMLSQPKRPQQPGLQNQTSGGNWWGGQSGGTQPQQPQMATNPYGGTVPVGPATAPPQATSGYGTINPPPPPPPVDDPTNNGGGGGGNNGGGGGGGNGGGGWESNNPNQWMYDNWGDTGTSVSNMQNEIKRALQAVQKMQFRANKYDTKSGKVQDIANSNKNRAIYEKSAKEWQDRLKMMLNTYKGQDYSAQDGFDPRASLNELVGAGPSSNWYGGNTQTDEQKYMNDMLSQMWGM